MNKEERKCMQPEIYLLRDEKNKYSNVLAP